MRKGKEKGRWKREDHLAEIRSRVVGKPPTKRKHRKGHPIGSTIEIFEKLEWVQVKPVTVFRLSLLLRRDHEETDE